MRIFHVLRVEGAGDHAVAGAADAQRGLITTRQLAAAGLGRKAVSGRVQRGWLHPALPRVFAVGHGELMPLARELAAALCFGHDVVVSGASACVVWGFVASEPDEVEVTLVGRDARRRPGLIVHRVEALDGRDVRLHHGLPVTSPARAVIDYAATATSAELERAVAEARVLKLITDRDLQTAIQRAPLRAGVKAVQTLLKDEAGRAFTRSEAERVLRKLVADAGLPPPQTNVKLLGFEVDMLWPQQRVVVEVDGYSAHGHARAFDRDRRRDQMLQAAGYVVIRVTWRQLKREPVGVAVRIAQTLAARGPK